jgi:hypothetical protein
MILVMKWDESSCPWNKWLNLRVEQLKNVHGPIGTIPSSNHEGNEFVSTHPLLS